MNDEIEYCVVSDNDSHKYIIPYFQKNHWYLWCEIPSEDERSWNVPEYAKQLDGGTVVFKNYRIG